ncbi:hypothetical protein JCM10207_000166 [Rhodosporidiobolus poonsookiae]
MLFTRSLLFLGAAVCFLAPTVFGAPATVRRSAERRRLPGEPAMRAQIRLGSTAGLRQPEEEGVCVWARREDGVVAFDVEEEDAEIEGQGRELDEEERPLRRLFPAAEDSK